jgi:hypothetical protein
MRRWPTPFRTEEPPAYDANVADPSFFIMGAVAIGVGVSSWWSRRSGRRDRHALWRTAAGLFPSGSIEPAVCDLGSDDLKLTADVAGSRVTATSRRGERDRFHIKVTARPAARIEGLSLRLTYRWHSWLIHRVMRHAATGDPDFDGQFRLEAADVGLALLWLDAPVRRLVLATSTDYAVEDGIVTSTTTGPGFDDAEALAARLRSVANLASRTGELVRTWEALASALGAMVEEGGLRMRLERQGRAFTILVGRLQESPGPVTHVRTGARGEHFVVQDRNGGPTPDEAVCMADAVFARAYGIRSDDATRTLERLREPIAGDILHARPVQVALDDDGLCVTLAGCETRPEALEGAMALATAIDSTEQHVGPYR